MHEPTKQTLWSTFTIIHMHKPLPSSQAAAVVGWTQLTTNALPQKPEEIGAISQVVFLASATGTTKGFLCESVAAYVSLYLHLCVGVFMSVTMITTRMIILHSVPLLL